MSRKLPKLSRHKRSGRGYATDPFTRKEVYFGTYDTPQCQAAYDAWIVQLIGRRAEVSSGAPPGSKVTVAGLLGDYLDYAETWYRKHGKPTSELRTFRQIAQVVNELAGTLAADAFGPSQFKAVRQTLIRQGLARGHINHQMSRVRQIFKWGVEQELVRAETLVALQAVRELPAGRTGAREEEPVEPVALEVVNRTLQVLDTRTAAMVRLHLHGAMRAQDVVVMRPCDLTWTDDSCMYVPSSHKTEHHGKERRLWLGPVCREVLRVLLASKPKPDVWLFATKRGNHVSVKSYRQRIVTACEKHGIPLWTPLQLRHTALTMVREQFGAEAAQVAGGHAHLSTTEIYSARDEVLARRIAEEMG